MPVARNARAGGAKGTRSSSHGCKRAERDPPRPLEGHGVKRVRRRKEPGRPPQYGPANLQRPHQNGPTLGADPTRCFPLPSLPLPRAFNSSSNISAHFSPDLFSSSQAVNHPLPDLGRSSLPAPNIRSRGWEASFSPWRRWGTPETQPLASPARALSYLCFLGTECSISRRFPCNSTFPKDQRIIRY